MHDSVTIGCYDDTLGEFRVGYAIVAIDVIRATTSAVTAVARGRRCFIAPSLDAALQRAKSLDRPLLAGELGGLMPPGFDMNNSPADLDGDGEDLSRPLVLLSSSGTRLMSEACQCQAAYVGCWRNYAALAQHLAEMHSTVAVLGAATRGEFREEDQMCAAWIAEALLRAGYRAGTAKTLKIVEQWKDASPDACLTGNSAAYLRRSGQLKDLDFILNHVNDLDSVFRLVPDEVLMTPTGTILTRPPCKEAASETSPSVPA